MNTFHYIVPKNVQILIKGWIKVWKVWKVYFTLKKHKAPGACTKLLSQGVSLLSPIPYCDHMIFLDAKLHNISLEGILSQHISMLYFSVFWKYHN